jgi:hypothetical protein
VERGLNYRRRLKDRFAIHGSKLPRIVPDKIQYEYVHLEMRIDGNMLFLKGNGSQCCVVVFAV